MPALRLLRFRTTAIVPAPFRSTATAARRADPAKVALLMAASALALPPFPAAAQVTVEASVQSDLRDRGYSRSGERPVASVSVGYDDPSGFYLGAAVHGTVRGGE